mgnify:CR=1 FL=1
MGTRLQPFWQNWVTIGADNWVVGILRHGYRLPFDDALPPLTVDPPDLTYKPSHPLFQELRSQVSKLLEKRAIEVVPGPTPGYYSRLFLAPKKTGDWRPVIDLSHLNLFLRSPHFKMETANSILLSMKPGLWATSLDFKDAFFHIPVAESHRRYLRFKVAGTHYQFRALPFGLTTSPLVFTRVVKAVGAFTHSRGIHLLQYLDDWCLTATSPEEASTQTQWLLQLVEYLGFLVNREKSDLTPAQIFQFVGILFDLKQGRAYPAPHRTEAWLSLARRFQSSTSPPAQMWQMVLGHLTSLEKLVPRGRLFMRPLQFALKDQWDQSSQSQSLPVLLTQEARLALQWWQQPSHLQKGVSLTQSTPELRIFTDASTVGWGAHLDDLQTEGVWPPAQRTWHINNLELLALHLALRQFLPQVKGRRVLAMTDNTTVVGQVTNQGGTLSKELFKLTHDLLTWCDLHQIQLSARHIPGRLNVTADLLSRRHQKIQTEWSLSPQVARRIWKIWGQPHVDLFATAANAKLPVFVSPLPEAEAWKQDALSFPWNGLWAYAFPPFPLIMTLLKKIQTEPCTVVLVAPWWPAQAWFPLLLELATDLPYRLPTLRTLLRQTGSDVFHDRLQSLNLHVWRLSGLPSEHKASQTGLLDGLLPPTELAPRLFTTADGRSSVTGASRGKQILSRPLPP